jgi:hypothetical protein
MAKKWFVQPEAVRLDLGDGDWLLVKKRLTVGEQRRAMAMLVSEVRGDGRITPNFEMVGKANVLSYLVDWSLMLNDRRVAIDDEAKKAAAVNNLSPEAFDVIAKAIDAHIESMEAERDAEKNAPDGETASSATSSSVAG